MGFLLAKNPPVSSLTDVFLWCGVLIVVCLACIPVLVWLRRRLRAEFGRGESADFSVEQIRKLQEKGQLTKEEYKRLRRKTLGLQDGVRENPPSELTKPAGCDDGNSDEMSAGAV